MQDYSLIVMAQSRMLTFVKEDVATEESLAGPGVVGLEDKFQSLVDGYDRRRNGVAAQSILEIHHVVDVDRKHVDVVEKTSARNIDKTK